MNRECVKEKVMDELDSPLFYFAKEKLIKEATDGIMGIYSACSEEPEPDPPPELLPKIKKLQPYGKHFKIIEGGDNGVTTQDKAKGTWNVIGDVFFGTKKHGTGYYYLSPGNDPTVKTNWIPKFGTEGKAYGAICKNGVFWSLQTPKGSTWVGSQNCQIINWSTGKKSRTLQSVLNPKGVNWFFAQRGYNSEGPPEWKQVQIGCLEWKKQKTNEFKTPVKMYQGYIEDLSTFKYIGDVQGLVGPRSEYAATCSITYLPERNQWVAFLGDWTTSIIYQFVSDHIMGPFKRVDEYKFSPPMERHQNGGQWSGCFTATLFRYNGEWVMCWSGHGHEKDDNTFVVKLNPELESIPENKIMGNFRGDHNLESHQGG